MWSLTFSLIMIIFSLAVNNVKLQQHPENYCPKHFQFEKDVNNVTKGRIEIPFDVKSTKLTIRINVEFKGIFRNLKVGLELLTPVHQILHSPKLEFRATFPPEAPAPKITSIIFNQQKLCEGPPPGAPGPDGVTTLYAELRLEIRNSFSESTINDAPFTLAPPKKARGCGTRPAGTGGHLWLAALMRKENDEYHYLCTAIAVTDRFLLTSGHCLFFLKAPLFQKDDLGLIMAPHDLNIWRSDPSVLRNVEAMIVHPDYEQYTGKADLALIKTAKPINNPPLESTTICLVNEGLTPNLSQGTVAGWRIRQNPLQTPYLRYDAASIVPSSKCKTPEMSYLNMFCAGYRNSTQNCVEEYGLPLLADNDGIWYLKGIIVKAVRPMESTKCNKYGVFVNLFERKLVEWIRNMSGIQDF